MHLRPFWALPNLLLASCCLALQADRLKTRIHSPCVFVWLCKAILVPSDDTLSCCCCFIWYYIVIRCSGRMGCLVLSLPLGKDCDYTVCIWKKWCKFIKLDGKVRPKRFVPCFLHFACTASDIGKGQQDQLFARNKYKPTPTIPHPYKQQWNIRKHSACSERPCRLENANGPSHCSFSEGN